MRIAAIILAAGSSSRMGSPKQILQFRGSSLLRRAATAAIDAGCDPVVVVTGANDDVSRRELNGLNVLEVWNGDWATGMASSIRAGVQRLGDTEIDAAILMLCDQPHVTADVIAALIAAHRDSASPIVASAYGGSFGAPALFNRTLLPELAQLEGAAGAKHVIARHEAEAHFVTFPAGEVDVDTPEDLSQLTAKAGRSKSRSGS
jgi:molybdenum cofactor cytidylyltransferase